MRGSPQGGVLSPLIWNIIINTLLTTFKCKAVKVVGYADDIILLVSGKDPQTLVNLMQKAIKEVVTWGNKNGLTFNPEKTSAVIFTKKHDQRTVVWKKLTMSGKNLEYDKVMKYLSVTLSKNLSWSNHVSERIAKATKILTLAKAAIGMTWGLTPEKVLWVYTAMVRPIVTYGALVWDTNINKTIIRKLRSLQRMVLKNITQCNAFHTHRWDGGITGPTAT